MRGIETFLQLVQQNRSPNSPGFSVPLVEIRDQPRFPWRGLSLDVEIDGGVKADNIADVKAAGANVFVSGSGIFGQKDYRKIVAEMRDLIAQAHASDQ